jgi:hypothetical protein
MESMEVYHEAMATKIIARVTNGKCEGAEFVFGLIESAIRKEATEIVLIPVQELDMVRMDFGRPYCYYRQPDITRAQFAYLAIYLVLIGNVAAEKARTADQTEGSTICNSEECAYLTTSPLSSSTSNQRDPGLRFRTRSTIYFYTSRYGPPHLEAHRRGFQIGLWQGRHKTNSTSVMASSARNQVQKLAKRRRPEATALNI